MSIARSSAHAGIAPPTNTSGRRSGFVEFEVEQCPSFVGGELDRDPGAVDELRGARGRSLDSPLHPLAESVTLVPASACGPGAVAPYESNPSRSGRFSGTSISAGHAPERNASHSASVSVRCTADSASLHQLVRRQGVHTDGAVRSRPHRDRCSGIDVVLDSELLEREVHGVDRLLGREPEVDGLAHRLHREQQGELRVVIDQCGPRRGHEIVDREQVFDVAFGVEGRAPLHRAEHRERGDEDGRRDRRRAS